MVLNKLQIDFKDAIDELTLLVGRNGATLIIMNNAAQLLSGTGKSIGTIGSGGLPFYDITEDSLPNTQITCEQYNLTEDNLQQELSIIMNKARLLYISQAYEVLESFLYNQIAQLIIKDSKVKDSIKLSDKADDFSGVRKALKRLKDRNNNEHLIRILREHCKLFTTYESENIYNKDFKEWFIMLGAIRHCITHNRSTVSNEVKQNLNSCYIDRFEIKTFDNKEMLYVNFGHCSQLLLDIGNFIFFVHKSIMKHCYNADVTILSMKDIFPDLRFIRKMNGNVELIS